MIAEPGNVIVVIAGDISVYVPLIDVNELCHLIFDPFEPISVISGRAEPLQMLYVLITKPPALEPSLTVIEHSFVYCSVALLGLKYLAL